MLYALYFAIVIFLSFSVPGVVLLERYKLGKFQAFVLGTMLGLVLWIWQGFIFGYLGLRFMTYVYVFSFFLVWVYKIARKRKTIFKVKKINIQHILNNKWILIVIFLGVLMQVSAVWFTGVLVSTGVYFCCGNISDSLYHIALTNQIVKTIPPYEPGMYGIIVHNYHYLSSLVVAELIRVYKLPLVATDYQFMSLFISLFLGLTAVSFSKSLNLSRNFLLWLLFFLYFGGDFIYVFLLILGKGLSFSMGSLEDGSIFLVNLPRAYAVTVLFSILSMLVLWIKKRRVFEGVLIGLMISVLIGLKVYVGIFALVGIVFLTVYFLFKKEWVILPIFITSILGSLVFYLPVNSGAGGIYYTGFWLFENFISQPQFGLIRMELARTIYQQHNNVLRLIEYEGIYILIYVFCIFGSKIIAFFQTKKSLSQIPLPIHIFLISGLVSSCILGFFYQQNSGGSNSFNFTVNVFILISIYAALAISFWLNRLIKPVAIVLAMGIILITVPRVMNQFYANAKWVIGQKGFFVANNQLDLLSALNKISEKNSLVLVHSDFSEQEPTTPLISFITDRPMFLSGEGILVSHNIPIAKRAGIKKTIFKSANDLRVGMAIRNENIQYILLPKGVDIVSTRSAEYLQIIKENKYGRLIKVSESKLIRFLDRMNKNKKK